jgi:two-component system OmpR family response regulator
VRILIVEDDKRTSDYLRKGFLEAGHVADTLVDGRDALAHATREAYDVLIVASRSSRHCVPRERPRQFSF